MGGGRLVLAFLMTAAVASEVWAQAGSAQVSFSGELGVAGSVTTGVGITFPDGTVQTSAATTAGPGITANAGLYDNRIVDFSPPLPYVEICFVGGGIEFDIHVNHGESTTGGECTPGDRGWVIERDERAATFWAEARAECLMSDMRLLEPFEFQVSCRRAGDLGLLNVIDSWEWAGNHASPVTWNTATDFSGMGAPSFGNGGCDRGGWGELARSDQAGEGDQLAFRCGR